MYIWLAGNVFFIDDIMNRIVKLLAFGVMALSLASCAKSRAEQMKLAENIQVDCTPEVLALKGQSIPAEITVTFPVKYFEPSVTMVVTPVLVYEGGEQVGKSYTYQGEKVKDNYDVIAFKEETTVRENVSFEYVKGVETSYLELRAVAYYKDNAIELPAIKVADGCNVTQLMAVTGGEYTFRKDAYQDVLQESTEGQVLYNVNSAVVKNSELKSESVKDFQAALEKIEANPRYSVTGTKVVAYASPEGGQEFNAKLSDKRAQSAMKAWDKVTGGMSADDLQTLSMGQDWEGFQEAVANSNIEDKDLILRVLSMYSDPAVREREIRNMSKVYTEVNKNIFPELRRARFIAELSYRNYSADELEQMSRDSIDILDEEAVLRAAANADDAARKAELYKFAAKKFNSDRATYNLALLSLDADDPEQAEAYLESLKSSDSDVINAEGVCELQKGNYDEAAKLFKKAGTAEANENLASIDIIKGDYAAAAKRLEGTDSHNKAVVYILLGDLDKAEASITCNCARSNYLRAIIAARRGDAAQVEKYLDKVAEQSPAMRARADKDVEFANYR